MKRIFSFIAACATMFALAACQEELQQPVEQPVVPGVEGELQQVTFSVSVPQDPQTKAISDGMKATNLEYAVYRAEAYSYTDDAGKTETYPAGEYIPALSQGANAKVTEMHTTDELKWEVVLTLAKNVKYDIVFWAYADDAPYTFDEPNAQIKVNDKYEGPANDDTRDAFFYRCDEYAVITSDTKVELRRPFAQINFGSSDYDPYITDLHLKMTSTFDTDAHAAKDAVYENDDPDGRLLYPAVPAVAATKLPTVLNVLDGSVSGEEIVKFMTTPIPYENGVDQVLMVTDQDGDETTTTDQTTYHWMSMNYVLAGEEATIDNIHAVFTYNNQDLEINVPNVPFKRNYKTNIIGNLFTEEAKFNVVVVPDYYTPDYIYDMDLTLAEAFTQNRDVEFTLTEDTVIEEPLILDNGRTLTLNLDEYSITTETGLWNTANGVWSMISVRNGSTLVINSEGGKVVAMKDDAYAVDVRDGSTLTINGGEYVGNISAVYVHDGTANINGGSYSILQLAEEANGGDERFTLNCEDGAYRDGKAVINVTGGSFVNYDPSDNLAEGQNTNFVAAGYVAVPSEVEGKTVYTVKKNAVLAAVAAGSDAVTIEGTEEFVKPVMIESGKTFTLTLGDEAVLTSLNTDPDTHASVFEVHGELVIEGNGTVDAGSNAASNIAVWARGEGAKVTIKSGNFKSGVDSEGQSSPVIYASKPATIEIYGGTFEAAPNNNDFANKPTYPALNLHGSVEKTATITVYGGTFVNFNPANPGTESAEWIAAHPNGFVADGYTVESEEKDGKTYYTVVEKKGLSVVSLADFLAAQVSADDWYQLTGMITKVENTTYGNFYIQDENGTEVYVYGLTETQVEKNDKTYANLGLEVGDVVTFNSLRAEFNGAAQAGGSTNPAYYISHTDAVVTYGIVGTLNGWGSTDDIKMASIYDKYHVAYNINLSTQDAFKIRTFNDANWSTNIGVNNEGKDGAFTPDASFAAYADGNSKDIYVLKDGKYDVYYKDGNIYILNSGKTPEDITTLSTPVEPELKRADENTTAPENALANLNIAGTFNGWSDTEMTLDGDWYVSPVFELNGEVEFKFKEKNNWDKSLGGEYYRQAFVGNEYPTTGGNNIKAYGLEGSYCIYLAKDQSRFKIEKYVETSESTATATLTFDDTSKRTEYDTSKQVWEENGITITNEKGSSTSNVADYSNPARFYKSSSLTVAIEAPMTSIAFTCNTTSYATALQSSIKDGIVSVDGKVVTVTLDGSTNNYAIVLTGGQVRMDSVAVTYTK